MTVAAARPRLHAQLEGSTTLGAAGVTELRLENDGATPDVYRLTVETDFHQNAHAEPSIVRLEPGSSRTITVFSAAPVAVRVYSEKSGQRVTEHYLGR